MVHFVGAGPGAPDLITLRGKKYIEEGDIIIYAGSLVNPELLKYKKPSAEVYDSSALDLNEVISIMKRGDMEGKTIVRLHTGDPSIYGAVREQMDELSELGIEYDSTPGVSSFSGAAASLNMEYTLPGVSQSVLITRLPGRTPVPDKDPTEIYFLSAGDMEGLTAKLLSEGKTADTPCALCYKATWDDEKKYICTLGELADTARREGINRTALIIVGEAVLQKGYVRSKLYDPGFTTGYRKGKVPDEG